MKRLSASRPGFTMVELVFAIVVLGIVASIGAEIIAKTYESYIIQRAQYRANNKTELALNQIANRLRYAIPDTIVTRPNLGGTPVGIEDVTNPNMKVLQWVGYDGDGFEAMTSTSRRPGWSGFCDLDASTATSISTPGSTLSLADTIIGNLGGTLSGSRLYFLDGNNTDGYPVSGYSDDETITLSPGIGVAGTRITERYKLAWSSYAIEVDANNDLRLHYNFNPSVGTAINGSNSLLLHNVTNFRFKSSGGAFRIKICKTEQIGMDTNATIHACKEKVVF